MIMIMVVIMIMIMTSPRFQVKDPRHSGKNNRQKVILIPLA